MLDESVSYRDQLVPFQRFVQAEDFLPASECARELARGFGVETAVQRAGDGRGWTVLVPRWAVSMIESDGLDDDEEEVMESTYDEDASDDRWADERHETLVKEFLSDQDDWARSEEDGWYYGD